MPLTHRLARVALLLLVPVVGGCPSHKTAKIAKKVHDQGLVFLARNQVELAEQRFRVSLEYNPKFCQAHNSLGIVSLKRNRLALAEKRFKKAISCNPDFAQARSNLGHVYFKQRKYRKACNLFHSSVKLNPQLLDPRYNLAQCLVRRRMYKKARAHLVRLQVFHMKHAPSHYLLGFIEFERKHYASALRHFVIATRLDGQFLQAHLGACQTAGIKGLFVPQACFHCCQAKRIDPRSVEAARLLALIMRKASLAGKKCKCR